MKFSTKRTMVSLGFLIVGLTACAMMMKRELFSKTAQNEIEYKDMDTTQVENTLPNSMYWNVWAEEGEAIVLQPVKVLKPNTDYLLAIDLSGRKYTDPSNGIRSYPAAQSTTEHLGHWAITTESAVDLEVIVVPDSYYFRTPRVSSIDFPVSSAKVSLFSSRKPLVTEIPLSLVNPKKDGSVDDYDFARKSIAISTGAKEGIGTIGFLVWSKKGRPLDEFAVRFCIAKDDSSEKCGIDIARVKTAFGGISAFLLRDDTLPVPDVAIQFFQLDRNRPLKGILHEKGTKFSDSIVWNLDSTASGLSDRYQNELLREIGDSSVELELLRNGAELFDTLFPDNPGDNAARKKVISMFNDERNTPKRKIVLIRLLQDSPEPPLIIPFGLMAPRKTNVSPTGFLGDKFRIETPMEFETPQDYTECVDRWQILLPPVEFTVGTRADTPIGKAVSFILSKNNYENPIHQIANWKALYRDVFPSWEKFRSNLTPSTAPFDPPQVIAILSHHDRNKLYLDDETYLRSGEFLRTLKTSSVAILAGCGVAGPGGSQVIRSLNRAGVTAIITASSSVSSFMGATFLDCLAKNVQLNSQQPEYRLSDGFERAVDCVRDVSIPRTTTKHGSNALKFTLLGNGYTRICPPR